MLLFTLFWPIVRLEPFDGPTQRISQRFLKLLLLLQFFDDFRMLFVNELNQLVFKLINGIRWGLVPMSLAAGKDSDDLVFDSLGDVLWLLEHLDHALATAQNLLRVGVKLFGELRESL